MIMKREITIIVLVCTAIASCSRFDVNEKVFDNSAYLTVSAKSEVQPTSFGNKLETLTKELAVALAYPSDADIKASVNPDFSLVAAYNKRFDTSYEALPAKYLAFKGKEVTIPAGKARSETVSITLQNLMGEGAEHTGALEIDKTWLLPVKVSSQDIATMDGSCVAYYLVKRSSAITNAAQLTDNWIEFPLMETPGPVADAYNGLTAITYEALINVDRFDLNNDFGSCSISSVMGVEQYLLLRIGDAKFERQQLQFDGSGGGSQFGKMPAKTDPTKKLIAGQWYHVACTYDQNTRIARILVNGKVTDEIKDAGIELPSSSNRINLAMRALGMNEAYPFRIGWSYNDFRPLQGKIAEARVWKTARTPEEIWKNMYRIAEPQTQKDLIGYWKFDEGKGNTITDYSIVGNNGVAKSELVWPAGIEVIEMNKTEE